MACTVSLNGIQVDCEPSMGGLKVVYINSYSKVTPHLDEVNDKIDQITLDDPDNDKFKTYSFRRNTASMTSTLSVDPANGNSVATDVSLSFLQQDTAKRNDIAELSIGELAMIVLDANGRYWYLGYDMPVMASAGGAESGTVYTDGNRYTITLQDNSKTYPYEIRVKEEAGLNYVDIDSIVE